MTRFPLKLLRGAYCVWFACAWKLNWILLILDRFQSIVSKSSKIYYCVFHPIWSEEYPPILKKEKKIPVASKLSRKQQTVLDLIQLTGQRNANHINHQFKNKNHESKANQQYRKFIKGNIMAVSCNTRQLKCATHVQTQTLTQFSRVCSVSFSVKLFLINP